MHFSDFADLARFRLLLESRCPLEEQTVAIGNRTYRVLACPDVEALLDRVDTEAGLEDFPYGVSLWPAAVALAKWLAQRAGEMPGLSVLELGCGVGLPGIVARTLGAEVVQSDYLREAMDLARYNAAVNGVEGISYLMADWRSFDHRRTYDLVIGADILYTRSLHRELSHILAQVVAPGGRLALTDPVRPQSVEMVDRLESDGWLLDMTGIPVQFRGEENHVALFEGIRRDGRRNSSGGTR
jgi:predicted nicotinamide N-methyase